MAAYTPPTWRGWGPQPPITPPPRQGCLWLLGKFMLWSSLYGLVMAWAGIYAAMHQNEPDAADDAALQLGLLVCVVVSVLSVRRCLRSRRQRRARDLRRLPPQRLARARDPLAAVRSEAAGRGGGCYVGFSTDGTATWVGANPEHAVLVLGPPRSGKTSAVIVPAVIAHPGAVVSTSTKVDVAAVTAPLRARDGRVWLFDPTGTESLPGVEMLRWSPVGASGTWDGALVMARAMVTASSSRRASAEETHWSGRAVALLAPLLHAAALGERPMADVVRWVLRADLNDAGCALEDSGAEAAVDVLFRVADTHERERSSIFSTVANVLGAYNAEGARRVAAEPNFDAGSFVESTDTVFVTTPAHLQDLAAPLVVGLLEEIRHAAYARARTAALAHSRVWPPVLFALDECANIAPIHDLPALVSEAGGQGLQVLACFQDLSQVRGRWGTDVAEGFLSLFGTKVVLRDIADPRTLDALSLAFGEYDRSMTSFSQGHGFNSTDSTSYSTQRQRVLSPGEIANLPPGFALFVQGVRWWLVQLTPYYSINPWPAVLASSTMTK